MVEIKTKFASLALCATVLWSCQHVKRNKVNLDSPKDNKSMVNKIVKKMENPFYTPYTTAYQIPPFQAIENKHYMAAFQKGMDEQIYEIDLICGQVEEPTFYNTVAALEESGALLRKVETVFYNLHSANTDEEMKEIAEKLSVLTARHNDQILLDKRLFSRIKKVYDHKEQLNLKSDEAKLLEDTYKNFVLGGALLTEETKNSLKMLNEKLALLEEKFSKNVLDERNQFVLLVENEQDLGRLSVEEKLAANSLSKRKMPEGRNQTTEQNSWAFTTHRSSFTPFMTYATNRDLREKMFEAYGNIAREKNEPLILEISRLRLQKANLLGFNSFSELAMQNQMAASAQEVEELLSGIWPAARAQSLKELATLQSYVDQHEKSPFPIKAWDWWYYSNKVKESHLKLDDNEIKQFFSLENGVEGIFLLANKLFGLDFLERNDLPKYHPDVRTFEVYDQDSKLIGVYFLDPYSREGKRGGAWMNTFRQQHRENSQNIIPIVVNVLNFTKPSEDKYLLLSFEETETLFHEFGHALHGLLSDVRFASQSGTNVPRDFVEFPSQVLENWLYKKDFMKEFAYHYQTGKPINDEMVDLIAKGQNFNQGFKTVEYMAATYLDLAWHELTKNTVHKVSDLEKEVFEKIHLIPEIAPRYHSAYFLHSFGSGYSSRYYSYMWSNVMGADAFKYFEEKGIFNKELASLYKQFILSKGGSEHSATLYKRFRGRKPSSYALVESLGFSRDSSF